MKILLEGLMENPVSLMRKAGYTFQRTTGDEMGFVRIFSQSGYPRFHCYTKVTGVNFLANLHLDQKKHTYGNATAHHGEYEDSPLVTEEGTRLLKIFGEKAHFL